MNAHACHRQPSDPPKPIFPQRLTGCFFVCVGLQDRAQAAADGQPQAHPGLRQSRGVTFQARLIATHTVQALGRAGVRAILYTVARTSRAQRFSSTAVYPPCPRSPARTFETPAHPGTADTLLLRCPSTTATRLFNRAWLSRVVGREYVEAHSRLHVPGARRRLSLGLYYCSGSAAQVPGQDPPCPLGFHRTAS